MRREEAKEMLKDDQCFAKISASKKIYKICQICVSKHHIQIAMGIVDISISSI